MKSNYDMITAESLAPQDSELCPSCDIESGRKNESASYSFFTYDIAAFVWPAYTGNEPRTRIFWPEGIGEWESVKSSEPKYDGHTWPRKPLWGYVNEADSAVMEMQIEEAVKHGVNTFIYDWYWYDNRPFLENCLNDGFLKAKNNGKMKFYLMWANHNVDYLWDKRNSDKEITSGADGGEGAYLFSGAQNRVQFEIIADRWIEKYFSQPNYYRIDGKPVIMIYCLPIMISGLGGIEETKDAIKWFRERCVKAGLGGVHIQLGIDNVCCRVYDGGRLLSVDELSDIFGFDSSTNYQMKNFSEGIHLPYHEIATQASIEWKRLGREQKLPYFPQVSVGWDNNPRFHKRKPIIEGSSPEEFERALRLAKEYLDENPELVPLITINSWNEWTEGSYLEPDDLFGYGYLEAVRRVFSHAKDT